MALLLEGITKKFNGSRILDRISFTVNDDEFICLAGQSGCGKTTLLRIIAGLELPTDGAVMVDGEEVKLEKGDIGFVFQENSLFPWLNIYGNIEFGLRINNVPPGERKKIINYHLELVDLQDFSGHYPHQLSGGMKQRATIARAIAYNPKILLMDEPFASLDEQTRNNMQEELLKLWYQKQKTVIFVTHSIDEAIYLSDRVIVMGSNGGEIKEVVDVNLTRPRQRTGKEFNELRKRILDCINS